MHAWRPVGRGGKGTQDCRPVTVEAESYFPVDGSVFMFLLYGSQRKRVFNKTMSRVECPCRLNVNLKLWKLTCTWGLESVNFRSLQTIWYCVFASWRLRSSAWRCLKRSLLVFVWYSKTMCNKTRRDRPWLSQVSLNNYYSLPQMRFFDAAPQEKKAAWNKLTSSAPFSTQTH